ncbi:hypothetical protein ABC195_15730 [Microbacterium sp. 2P01SA-2]|uniref:hypothetical protein n=1 Tax=unclassified Microbacterium TaxID=2609290 RepID=UPI0039A1040E
MSDLARFLPLSHRSPDGAAAAPADRRVQISTVIALAAAVLEAASDDARRAFIDDARLSRDGDGTASLAELAGTVVRGRRRSARDLTAVARAYLRLPGPRPPLPFDVAGAVALAASTTAPFARRAAIAGHTVRATDAGWTFGRGPEVSASADDIVAFLTGVSDVPPRRSPVS